MKKVIYYGKRVSFKKSFALIILCTCLCFLVGKSQTTYLSSFPDPTSRFVGNDPSCLAVLSNARIIDASNVATESLTDYASITTPLVALTLGCPDGYSVRANLNLNGLSSVPASTNTYYAGFRISVSSTALLNLLNGGNGNLVIKTFLDGNQVETLNGLPVGLSLLVANTPGNIYFQPTQPFNQVQLELSNGLLGLGAISTIRMYYAYASTTGTPIILPVKLTSFLATANKKSVDISWTAASETNVARYELQRSSNGGATFSTITTIAAKGTTTTETSYSFADAMALAGNYTYRLKMVDKDGGIEYSKLALVKIASGINWKVYPTLLSSGANLNVSVAANNSGKAQVQLVNLQGQILHTINTVTDSKLTINTSGLSAGIYVLKLYKDGQLQATEKVVIQ